MPGRMGAGVAVKEQDRRPGAAMPDAERRLADADPLECEPLEQRPAILATPGQLLMREATSYFLTEERCPGVSPPGIAFRISSAFA